MHHLLNGSATISHPSPAFTLARRAEKAQSSSAREFDTLCAPKIRGKNSPAIPPLRARKICQFPHLMTAVSSREAKANFRRALQLRPQGGCARVDTEFMFSSDEITAAGKKAVSGGRELAGGRNRPQPPPAATETRRAITTRQVLCTQQARRAFMSSRRKSAPCIQP